MLLNIYGLLAASFFVVMDAVDVAFTEAAIGTGISTLLLLSTLTLTGRYEKEKRHQPWLTLGIVSTACVLLIYGTLQMPAFGSALAPIHLHVAPHYIRESLTEIGVPNIVTSILASYRGYDTLGELTVIFTAGVGVLALLKININQLKIANPQPMHEHRILRIVSKTLIPFILLFGLYVQFHGDFGPGGGFQAGVIFSSGVILYMMIFGLEAAGKVIKRSWLEFLSATGILIFSCVGVLSLLSGENFLNYNVLAKDAVQGQHLGILIVELGVGLTVASVIMLIFYTFTEQMASKR